MISRSKSRSDNRNHYDYCPHIRITMIHDGAMKYICEETGLGKITISGVRPSRPKSLPLYTWYIVKRSSAVLFLQGIIPYLKIKKNRALHLLEFCKKNPAKGNRHIKPSDEELNCREDMYWKMREFNSNKVGATTKPLGHESACDSLNS